MRVRDIVAGAAGVVLLFGVSEAGAGEISGTRLPHGQGTVESYAVLQADGTPAEIGVIFSKGALDGLPAQKNRTSRCFDLNGDGRIGEHDECEGDHQSDLPLPAEVTARDDIPFGWAMVNWNPEGHPPPVWSLPHFDIHFYSIAADEVQTIRVGPCGIFMHCDDFARATKPVPAKYVHPDHVSVQASVGQMGDHLIDSKTPELANPPAEFTHTWIFGAYDGSIIFHETMATHAFMSAKPQLCADIKLPQAWAQAGWYPTRYCFRHEEASGRLKVFMEGFVRREAG